MEKSQGNVLTRVVRFYVEGFRSMTVGKTLWAIILIKLFIMFAILKVFFFPDILKRDYDNDADRAEHVRRELSKPRQHLQLYNLPEIQP